ncbi:Ribosomal RNA small subunit methyltransferase E [Senna tora]|uniref:Ribosomal RNA small subunit methyltransferase E n=1 Tax=Senna tora TaxID=362788 RepID=A0A834TGY8_9FABA|nr:Ribosomal RNA small subunit methyltransferase E [Senna tora]
MCFTEIPYLANSNRITAVSKPYPKRPVNSYCEHMDNKVDNNVVKKIMSPCDVEALKKCLEENKGDYVKCQTQIEAFKSSCSLKKPNPPVGYAPPRKTEI